MSERTCTHSISKRLSSRLALLTVLVMGALLAVTWLGVGMLVSRKNVDELHTRAKLVKELIELEAKVGGEAAVQARLKADAPMRANSHLELRYADGRPCYVDAGGSGDALGRHVRSESFQVLLPDGKLLDGYFAMDFSRDAEMGRQWAALLVVVTLAAGAAVAGGTWWRVRRELQPLHELAAQTRAILPQRLDQRLSADDPGEELLPWIEQFNRLMDRLERAYTQLEAFNADVAHELRTPLATLMGEAELALSRDRSAESLRDTLASHLEELQRLSALVNDMLFLASVDRGAQARRGAPVSLAALARQVAEFHEGALDEAGLKLEVVGDATVAVDEPLVKRALSNLLGNATRYATPGSTVEVRIGAEPGAVAGQGVELLVRNQGQPIAEPQLPRLFDRFFRGDESRCCVGAIQHHGLGLAIVAAIARMHAGRTLARSQAGITEVGFSVAPA